jgi:hypothetical protein
VADNDEKSSFVEIAMILGTAIPVLGAMISAPMVGTGLATLAIGDSLLMLIVGK